MVEVGGRLGLGVETLHVGGRGELAGEDHLQRDGPIEACLPSLVDDTHAAAGDLFHQLVVPEVMHDLAAATRMRRKRGGHCHSAVSLRGDRRRQRLDGLAELRAIVEEGDQVGGHFGMGGQELGPVRLAAGFGGLQIGGDDFIDALVVGGRVAGFGGHDSRFLVQLSA